VPAACRNGAGVKAAFGTSRLRPSLDAATLARDSLCEDDGQDQQVLMIDACAAPRHRQITEDDRA
jgi:hypothetical protein